MFTGIVQGQASLVKSQVLPDVTRYTFEFPNSGVQDVFIGASVSLAGCCLTVTAINGRCLDFDLVAETLKRTTLGALQLGDTVNFERSLRVGSEVGGHFLSGHVDTTATIVDEVNRPETRDLTFKVPPEWFKYIFEKGYVALDGASLTVASTDPNRHRFSVALIPETIRITTFAKKKTGDRINIEIDRTTQAIVDTVERYLARN